MSVSLKEAIIEPYINGFLPYFFEVHCSAKRTRLLSQEITKILRAGIHNALS